MHPNVKAGACGSSGDGQDVPTVNVPLAEVTGAVLVVLGEFVSDYLETKYLIDSGRFAYHGDGARTVFSRFLHVCIFLRAMGHRNLPKRSSFPRKVERLPEEYNGKQLTALLNAATPGERLILELLMCSGMRNQEVANLHVAD